MTWLVSPQHYCSPGTFPFTHNFTKLGQAHDDICLLETEEEKNYYYYDDDDNDDRIYHKRGAQKASQMRSNRQTDVDKKKQNEANSTPATVV